jgi:hypothetical protein
VVEREAVHVSARLQRAPEMTMRAYMEFLMDESAPVRARDKVVERYLELYERARFSDAEVDVADFASFLKCVAAISKAIEAT